MRLPSYSPIIFSQVYGPDAIPIPLNENSREFVRQTPLYRLNLLAAEGQILYFPYSSSSIARYRIHRSNGVILEPLPSCVIDPPTSINNTRIANFPSHIGGCMLLMTGGCEMTPANGTLTIMQLRHPKNNPVLYAHTTYIPATSAWGLAVHEFSGRLAISSNSQTTLVLGLFPSQGFIYHHGPEDSAYSEELPGHSQYYRRFQIALLTETEPNTHLSNIPCVAFNKSGTLLASASIDTTFAIFDLKESSKPPEFSMDLFVKCLSGRKIYQCSLPVAPRDDRFRTRARNWNVHWLYDNMICDLAAFPDVEETWHEQHKEGVAPPLSLTHFWKTADLFERHARDHSEGSTVPQRYGNDSVLYDDCPDEGPGDGRFNDDCPNMDSEEEEKRIVKESVNSASYPSSETKIKYPPPPPPSPMEKKGLKDEWRKRRQTDQEAGKWNLLLVCLEQSIELYDVAESLRDKVDAKNVGKCEDVVLLDTIRLNSDRWRNRRQLMFTNVIEIPKLRAVVITGVGCGVLVVRIVMSSTGSIRWPTLLVERLFPVLDHVIGTCVIERDDECPSLRSFELWILQQCGQIEAWDLAADRMSIDASCFI